MDALGTPGREKVIRYRVSTTYDGLLGSPEPTVLQDRTYWRMGEDSTIRVVRHTFG
jgi:hypothetical protein